MIAKHLPFLSKRIKSFRFAFQGLSTLLRTQPNARVHLVVAVLVIGLGVVFHLALAEWACLCLTIASVFAAEAFNTAIEFLADRVTTEHDPLIGQAKDVAAAAVLIVAIGSVAVGLAIFGPRLFVLWFYFLYLPYG